MTNCASCAAADCTCTCAPAPALLINERARAARAEAERDRLAGALRMIVGEMDRFAAEVGRSPVPLPAWLRDAIAESGQDVVGDAAAYMHGLIDGHREAALAQERERGERLVGALREAVAVPDRWPQGPACEQSADAVKAHHEAAQWMKGRLTAILDAALSPAPAPAVEMHIVGSLPPDGEAAALKIMREAYRRLDMETAVSAPAPAGGGARRRRDVGDFKLSPGDCEDCEDEAAHRVRCPQCKQLVCAWCWGHVHGMNIFASLHAEVEREWKRAERILAKRDTKTEAGRG